VSSYLEDDSYNFIIHACRLKPYAAIFEKLDRKTEFHWWWLDEYGNSLKIIGKDVKIIMNDLLINKSKLVCTDMFAGLTLKQISENSKLAFILIGKEEDTDTEHFIVSFLRNDNFLQTYIYIFGVWELYPSLILGKKILTEIHKYVDSNGSVKLNNSLIDPVFPVSNFNCWITKWPAEQTFISNLGNDFLVRNIMKENNNE
jgi:hypothetical protein